MRNSTPYERAVLDSLMASARLNPPNDFDHETKSETLELVRQEEVRESAEWPERFEENLLARETTPRLVPLLSVIWAPPSARSPMPETFEGSVYPSSQITQRNLPYLTNPQYTKI